MEREEIRKEALNLTTRYSLLVLLNRIKKDMLGEEAFPFTIEQLNYFSNPCRNKNHYHFFCIPKKSGGCRSIAAPLGMLKSFLTCANVLLQALYEPSSSAMGFVPGRSIVDNARVHEGMNYVFNIDLKNFFPSIPQRRVWGALKSSAIGLNENIASCLAGLCCTTITFAGDIPSDDSSLMPYEYEPAKELRNVLPQGSPSSPMLTNIVCINLDRRLNGLAKRFGLHYTRYADDITFSSFHNVYDENGDFRKELRRIIEQQNFKINKKKTRLQKRGERQEVTGLVVCEKPNVTRQYIRGLSSLIYIWERYGFECANVSFRKHNEVKFGKFDYGNLKSVIQGRLMFLKMVRGENDPIYKKLKLRFASLVKEHHKSFTDLVYLSYCKVPEFEKEHNVKLLLQSYLSDGSWSCSVCNKKDEWQSLSISQNTQSYLKTLGDFDFDDIKDDFYVALCKGVYAPFYLLMKKRPLDVSKCVNYPSSGYPDKKEVNQEDNLDDGPLAGINNNVESDLTDLPF